MKLKDKLAKEYVEPRRGHQDQYAEMLNQAYLAGFEKAIELAVELTKEYNKRDFEKLKGSSYTTDFFPNQKFNFLQDLKKLGEEEAPGEVKYTVPEGSYEINIGFSADVLVDFRIPETGTYRYTAASGEQVAKRHEEGEIIKIRTGK